MNTADPQGREPNGEAEGFTPRTNLRAIDDIARGGIIGQEGIASPNIK